MRWMPARWCWWCRRCVPMRKRSRRATGPIFPPLGRRSNGGGQAFQLYANVPGGYRHTINDNLVLILMIETLAGLKDADRIAKIPGVTAIFAAIGDLGNHSRLQAGRSRL